MLPCRSRRLGCPASRKHRPPNPQGPLAKWVRLRCAVPATACSPMRHPHTNYACTSKAMPRHTHTSMQMYAYIAHGPHRPSKEAPPHDAHTLRREGRDERLSWSRRRQPASATNPDASTNMLLHMPHVRARPHPKGKGGGGGGMGLPCKHIILRQAVGQNSCHCESAMPSAIVL